MGCDPLIIDGQVVGTVCSRGRRGSFSPCTEVGCSENVVALCDWPLAGKAVGKTCSRGVCARHRKAQPPNPDGSQRDYCPAHDRAAKAQGSLL